jgi:hypothetical protein
LGTEHGHSSIVQRRLTRTCYHGTWRQWFFFPECLQPLLHTLEYVLAYSSGVRIRQSDMTQGHSVQTPRLLGESLLPLAPAFMPLHDASLRCNTHRARLHFVHTTPSDDASWLTPILDTTTRSAGADSIATSSITNYVCLFFLSFRENPRPVSNAIRSKIHVQTL